MLRLPVVDLPFTQRAAKAAPGPAYKKLVIADKECQTDEDIPTPTTVASVQTDNVQWTMLDAAPSPPPAPASEQLEVRNGPNTLRFTVEPFGNSFLRKVMKEIQQVLYRVIQHQWSFFSVWPSLVCLTWTWPLQWGGSFP